jgi:tetraacyldisaccharide 4'-kinase
MPKPDLPARLSGVRSPAPGLGKAPLPGSPRVREWVVRWWAGEGGTLGSLLRMAAAPLELGFRMVSGVWGRMYDSGMLPLQRAPVPVISVGNLTVGGSGKTPLAAWLLRGLRNRGESPALVASGYGQDEIMLHRRWNPQIPVIAEEDRAYAAWKAVRKGATVVVLDDGFQHRRLARELDIVLVAASTPGRVRLLPRGPFREPFSSLGRAGVVVLTQKGRAEDSLDMEGRIDPFIREAPVKVAFVPSGWTDLSGGASDAPGGDFLAVTGIGEPEGFFRVLRETLGAGGELLSYPDHHSYSWPDVQAILDRARGRTIVTTEKDAVKLAAFQSQLKDLRILCLKVEVLEGEERLWRHVEGILKTGPREEGREA